MSRAYVPPASLADMGIREVAGVDGTGAGRDRGVRTSYWDGAQHGLFIENPVRFVTEVADFVASLD